MKSRTAFVMMSCVLASLVGSVASRAQTQPQAAVTPSIPGVVARGTPVRMIKSGFKGTEGPVRLDDASLLFVEREASKITKIDGDGNASSYLENSGATNSLTIDPKGRLIGVRWTPPQVAVISPTPSVLADQFEGKPFGRPNDLTVDRQGGVYFTDSGVPGAIYYITPANKLVKLTEGVTRPNGIVLSPDEKILYVVDTAGSALAAFDVQPDGTIFNRRDVGRLVGVPRSDSGPTLGVGGDGLTIDAEGRLYVATTVGIQVLSPKGQHLGTIPIPKPPPGGTNPLIQNAIFAGPEKKTLFVLGGGAVYTIQTLTRGVMNRASK